MTDDNMAHLNRRSQDPEDGGSHRILSMVESTQAKFFARFVWPLLLAALGFFLVRTLDRIEETQSAQIFVNAQIQSDVRNLNTRLDEGVIRQVNTNTQAIQAHEQRLQVLERTVKTP